MIASSASCWISLKLPGELVTCWMRGRWVNWTWRKTFLRRSGGCCSNCWRSTTIQQYCHFCEILRNFRKRGGGFADWPDLWMWSSWVGWAWRWFSCSGSSPSWWQRRRWSARNCRNSSNSWGSRSEIPTSTNSKFQIDKKKNSIKIQLKFNIFLKFSIRTFSASQTSNSQIQLAWKIIAIFADIDDELTTSATDSSFLLFFFFAGLLINSFRFHSVPLRSLEVGGEENTGGRWPDNIKNDGHFLSLAKNTSFIYYWYWVDSQHWFNQPWISNKRRNKAEKNHFFFFFRTDTRECYSNLAAL